MSSTAKPVKSTKTSKTSSKPVVKVEAKADSLICDPCETLGACFERHIDKSLTPKERDEQALFYAFAMSVKDQMLPKWRATRQLDRDTGNKKVAYLSLE